MLLSISSKRRLFEIAGVVTTALGKFLFIDFLHWPLPFIVCTLMAWLFYAYSRWKFQPAILRHWGFRTDNLGVVFRRLLPLALAALAGCLIIGYVRGTLNLTWHIIPILILYPIWGTIQQFLCVALVTGNMQNMRRPLHKTLIILITATLFSLLHYPNLPLIAGTFVLALIYSSIYLQERNLYALGLFHGWLGALFYYTVVERDPFIEVFGALVK